MNFRSNQRSARRLLAALVIGSTAASAAPVTWTSKPYPVSGGWGQFPNTGVFDTSGTQILAENTGGPEMVFDGITFSAGTISFSGVYGGFHDSAANLSRTGTYGGTGANTVTLTGLTPGNSYRVQALVYDGRGDSGIPGRRVSFDGTDQGQYANGVRNVTWGAGLLVTGTFVADSATQAFTIEAFYNGTSKGGQLNALLLHEFVAGAPVLSNPAATSITGDSARVDADLFGSDAGVTIHWATADQGTGPWENSISLGSLPPGPVGGPITGLQPDTIYFYRFHAINTGPEPDLDGWSPEGTWFATALTGLAPADVSAITVSKTEIDVEWTDGFNSETGFVIERSPGGTDFWIEVGAVGAGAQLFHDTGLLPGTSYHYRVFARNGNGLSEPSPVATGNTLPPDPGIAVQAWYRMGDAGSGVDNRPLDHSGNGRDFVTMTAAATVSPAGGGYGGDAFCSFNGVDQGYYGANYNAPEDNVGIEVWVRTSDLAQINRHVFGTGSNVNGLNIGWSAGEGTGWFGAVANVAFAGSSGTAGYSAGQWIHLAVVRQNGLTTFYVNGVGGGTSAATPLNATQPHLAVNYTHVGEFFNGDIAEARIFTFDPGQFNVSHLLYPAPPPSDPYAAWAAGFPSLTDNRADLDSDTGGLATGIEWVTGGDPTDAADDLSHAPAFDITGDPLAFRFVFLRRDAAAADTGTSIVVEYGNDLAGWRNTADHGATDGVTVETDAAVGNGFHQVTVSIPRALATEGKLFARLKVTRP